MYCVMSAIKLVRAKSDMSFDSPWKEDAKTGAGFVCSSNASLENQQNTFTK